MTVNSSRGLPGTGGGLLEGPRRPREASSAGRPRYGERAVAGRRDGQKGLVRHGRPVCSLKPDVRRSTVSGVTRRLRHIPSDAGRQNENTKSACYGQNCNRTATVIKVPSRSDDSPEGWPVFIHNFHKDTQPTWFSLPHSCGLANRVAASSEQFFHGLYPATTATGISMKTSPSPHRLRRLLTTASILPKTASPCSTAGGFRVG